MLLVLILYAKNKLNPFISQTVPSRAFIWLVTLNWLICKVITDVDRFAVRRSPPPICGYAFILSICTVQVKTIACNKSLFCRSFPTWAISHDPQYHRYICGLCTTFASFTPPVSFLSFVGFRRATFFSQHRSDIVFLGSKTIYTLVFYWQTIVIQNKEGNSGIVIDKLCHTNHRYKTDKQSDIFKTKSVASQLNNFIQFYKSNHNFA